ncbi:MAG TPA: hypothetical protein PKY27_10145 [Arachnia sp.]|jgi:Flp pilus assembly protein TadG|nr:hypothetical protein [Arachnia sp.]HQD22602.1 hypothetical protein [Arachnia sp.]
MTGERGAALSVWTAVMLPAFIVAVGLGVDFAGHAAAEQEARTVAGQAARVATHQTVLTAEGPVISAAAATREAEAFAAAAGWDASVGIRGQTAEVTLTGTYATTFLGLIGVTNIDVEGTASATAVPSG